MTKQEMLQKFVKDLRYNAKVAEKGYHKAEEMKMRLVTYNLKADYSDRLYYLVEALEDAKTPLEIINACDDIDEYIDETVVLDSDL